MKTANKKSIFFCTECGYESSGYLGRCSACGEWGSFKEANFAKASPDQRRTNQKKSSKQNLFINPESQIVNLQSIPLNEIARMQTGSSELDRVLGEGLVPGSLTLVGGEPGIGKSTLLLQVANNFALKESQVLYISAEESSRQLKLRASRLGIDSPIQVLAENQIEAVIELIEDQEPSLVIIDSIQAVYSSKLDALPGMPSQIRECAGLLMRSSKSLNIPIIIVGHINKDGDLAGPKILEHMVDTVLQFEGSRDSQIKFLRSIKNRFGSTDEIGVFEMQANGLLDVNDPSKLFLEQRSGGVIFPSREGRRTLLLELQALILDSDYHNPRRLANGINLNRLHQILAVLDKKLGLNLARADAYINIVGGLSIRETASDLACALAIYTSLRGISIEDCAALGELGLNGEIRAVPDIEARIRETIKLGLKTIIVPEINYKKLSLELKNNNIMTRVIPVKNIEEAVNELKI